ncbi:Myxococcus xanthus paralogous domain TIGR02266 [Malonomonas rubra DSM 5091]|uniref:Myxococcus xanthus paralogous domain TIGR02266 n=1 Tax=Malonomonas rubra DSM 5091 TaxID=1122189 RepID=A0A1M6LHG4_MALRU|nr:PilZ domain-containing protein [Malonomonas rubra]SHJ70626.1 Myxococcus xanthus paralogous domain TIGR02266 [Malonomonas rubra DSM 5091]
MNTATAEENGTPSADLRQNLRAPLIVQKIRIDSDRPVFFGYSKNISRSGLFIATTNPAEPGDQLDLEIPLPGSLEGTIRCRCEVVWRRPFGNHLPFELGMGIRFIDLPSELSKQIDDWIHEQHRLEAEKESPT